MLKSIDMLIGFALVMLLASMTVTFITQALVDLSGKRGKHLLAGLTGLLRQISPALPEQVAGNIATAVLKHPMIAEANGKLGTVVQREELVKILLELASPDSPSQSLDNAAKETLAGILKKSGIDNPAETLRNIRALSAKLETVNPELASHVRKQMAIFSEITGEFVNAINTWFDEQMDRLTQRFSASLRWVTLAISLILAFSVQLDTFRLFNQLSMDDKLRESLVVQAQQVSPSQTNQEQVDQLRQIASSPIIIMGERWLEEWRVRKGAQIPGILVSALLMSFGAPFWYDALKNLLRLRPLLASKEQEQRSERQTAQPSAQPAVAGLTPPAPQAVASLMGERGDLTAVG